MTLFASEEERARYIAFCAQERHLDERIARIREDQKNSKQFAADMPDELTKPFSKEPEFNRQITIARYTQLSRMAKNYATSNDKLPTLLEVCENQARFYVLQTDSFPFSEKQEAEFLRAVTNYKDPSRKADIAARFGGDSPVKGFYQLCKAREKALDLVGRLDKQTA